MEREPRGRKHRTHQAHITRLNGFWGDVDVFLRNECLIIEYTNPEVHNVVSFTERQSQLMVGFVSKHRVKSFAISRLHMDGHAWGALVRILIGAGAVKVAFAGCREDLSSAQPTTLADLISENVELRSLEMFDCVFSDQAQSGILRAVIDHPALESLRLEPFSAMDYSKEDRASILRCIRDNRVLKHFVVNGAISAETAQTADHRDDAKHLFRALRNNWMLLSFWIGTFERRASAAEILQRNVVIGCPLIHHAVQHTAIPLLPLRLPDYELLWILDWLPPLHYRFEWRNDPEYDPRHGYKMKLIWGLTRSYRKLKSL